MKTKSPQLDWREGRRRRAWELKEQGWKQQDIAAALGVTGGAVSQWLKRARGPGARGGRVCGAIRRPAASPGSAPSSSPRCRPWWSGGRRHTASAKRVAEVIRRTFGVTYHPAHVSRLLHAVRHSVQRPIQRATQRDAAAIQAWWRERWPALEKKAADEGRPVVWVDQSGFSLLPCDPMAVRTWAPCGKTPLLRVPLAHDHLAAISGITAQGRLFMQTQDHA